MPRYKIKRVEVLNLNDVLELIKQTDDRRLKCLIALAYTFGSRITEMLRLKRSDFAMEEDRLAVRFILEKKKKAAENKPMVPSWVRAIRKDYPLVPFIWSYVEPIEAGFIFKSDRSATGFLTRIWAHQLIKEIDSNLCWHFFRRSVITNVVRKTKSLQAAKQLAGHQHISTTESYVERDPALDEQLVARDY